MEILSSGVKTQAASFLSPANQVPRSNHFVSILRSGNKNPFSLRIYASISLSDFPSCSPSLNQGYYKAFLEKEPIFSDDLDDWVRGSVVEIVKNLKKAPLLAHVYWANGVIIEVKTEEGFAQNWPNLKKGWREGERKSPNGIILVEELKDNDQDSEIAEEEEERETKAWGLLIQGKGLDRECGTTACYLLKTCRVNSGLGVSGTHFSLVKVTSFRESAFSQMKNSWLLR